MAQTIHEKYAAYLQSTYAAKEIPSQSRAYRTFQGSLPTKNGDTVPRFFFLGNGGGMRMNDSDNWFLSIDVTDTFIHLI